MVGYKCWDRDSDSEEAGQRQRADEKWLRDGRARGAGRETGAGTHERGGKGQMVGKSAAALPKVRRRRGKGGVNWCMLCQELLVLP